MGQEESVQAPQYTVRDGFKAEQFQKQRNANTVELSYQNLARIGTDLSKHSYKVPLPMAVPHSKVLFIVVNTYSTKEKQLGSGGLNDSVSTAVNLKKKDYAVFFLFNSNTTTFIEWLKLLLKNAQEEIVLFYAGRSTAPPAEATEGAEKAGVITFDDGAVTEEELGQLFKEFRSPTLRTVLLADCAHDGSIWTLPDFKVELANLLTITTAKEGGAVEDKDLGIFTLYLWKEFAQNNFITIKELQEKVSTILAQYQLKVLACAAPEEYLEQPIFTIKKEEPKEEKKDEKPAEQPAKENPAEQPAEEKPAAEEEKPAEQPAAEEKPAAAAEETPAEQPAEEETPAEQPVEEEKPAEQPAEEEKPAEQPAEEE